MGGSAGAGAGGREVAKKRRRRFSNKLQECVSAFFQHATAVVNENGGAKIGNSFPIFALEPAPPAIAIMVNSDKWEEQLHFVIIQAHVVQILKEIDEDIVIIR